MGRTKYKLAVKWLLFFVFVLQCDCAIYKDFISYKVRVKSNNQLEALRSIQSDDKILFMNRPVLFDDSIFLVHYEKDKRVNKLLEKEQIDIVKIEGRYDHPNPLSSYRCKNNSVVTFKCYNNYMGIENWLKNLSNTFNSSMKLKNIGITSEGRPIFGVKITGNHSNLPVVFIEAGIFGDSWFSIFYALYIIKELLYFKTSSNERAKELLEKNNFFVVPVANPDGFDYSMTGERKWIKNRRTVEGVVGVNLNRNFNYNFNYYSPTLDPDSEEYAGPEPFSEPETIAIKEVVKELGDRLESYKSILDEESQGLSFGTSENISDLTVQDQVHDFFFGEGIQTEFSNMIGKYLSGRSGAWVSQETKKKSTTLTLRSKYKCKDGITAKPSKLLCQYKTWFTVFLKEQKPRTLMKHLSSRKSSAIDLKIIPGLLFFCYLAWILY